MLLRKKSYYLSIKHVKKLSGFTFYRLAVYHKNKMVDVLGYFDINKNILFVDFSLIYFYIYKGFDFINFAGLIGNKFRELNLGSILIMGLYNWLFFSKQHSFLKMPKKFWLNYFNRSLYIVYYLLFRNLIFFDGFKFSVGNKLAKILSKRFLVIQKLGLITKC
jgi:hypothetical protein